jgi:hypothetical protein
MAWQDAAEEHAQTEGRPMRFIVSPKSRPTSISVMSCARNTICDGPLAALPAAMAVPASNAMAAQGRARRHVALAAE